MLTRNPKLRDILPESITNDTRLAALADALDAQLADFADNIDSVLHLPRLDELTGSILDLLAWQFHVDFYEPVSLDDETKRNLIRESIAVHRLKGTVAAVKKVNAAFNRNIFIQEWFDYGGEPFHFKVIAPPFSDSIARDSWLRQLYDAKNVRSWIDEISEIRTQSLPLYMAVVPFSRARIALPMINDFRIPNLNVFNAAFAHLQTRATFPLMVTNDRNIDLFTAAITHLQGRSFFPLRFSGSIPDSYLFFAPAALLQGRAKFPLIHHFDFPNPQAFAAVVPFASGKSIFPAIFKTELPGGEFFAATAYFAQNRVRVPMIYALLKNDISTYSAAFVDVKSRQHFDMIFEPVHPDFEPFFAAVASVENRVAYPNFTSEDEIPRIPDISEVKITAAKTELSYKAGTTGNETITLTLSCDDPNTLLSSFYVVHTSGSRGSVNSAGNAVINLNASIGYYSDVFTVTDGTNYGNSVTIHLNIYLPTYTAGSMSEYNITKDTSTLYQLRNINWPLSQTSVNLRGNKNLGAARNIDCYLEGSTTKASYRFRIYSNNTWAYA